MLKNGVYMGTHAGAGGHSAAPRLLVSRAHTHTHTLGNTLSVPDSSYRKASTHNTVPPAEEAVNVCLMRLCADKEVQRETQHSISSSPCEV